MTNWETKRDEAAIKEFGVFSKIDGRLLGYNPDLLDAFKAGADWLRAYIEVEIENVILATNSERNQRLTKALEVADMRLNKMKNLLIALDEKLRQDIIFGNHCPNHLWIQLVLMQDDQALEQINKIENIIDESLL